MEEKDILHEATKQIAAGMNEFRSNPDDFMSLLEGDNKPKFTKNQKKSSAKSHETLAMKDILERFHNVASDSVTVMESKERNVLSRKNISTGREWKVVVNEDTLDTNYDIINTKANKSYFSNIKTLRATDLIIEHLEQKKPINSQNIFKILDLDETFRRNRSDAIQFKKRWKKCVEQKRYGKADIYEARYQKSKQQALDAKRELKRMVI